MGLEAGGWHPRHPSRYSGAEPSIVERHRSTHVSRLHHRFFGHISGDRRPNSGLPRRWLGRRHPRSVLTIIFGIIVVLNPLMGVVALPFVLGGFMLVGGIFAVVASLRMRRSPTATGE